MTDIEHLLIIKFVLKFTLIEHDTSRFQIRCQSTPVKFLIITPKTHIECKTK